MDLTSVDPYWRLKNGLPASYPTLKTRIDCDVLVVGGGISGALMLDTLVRAGLSVVLVEKRDVGAGSTSASTALLQYEIDTPLWKLKKLYGARAGEQAYRACAEAIDTIETRVQELDDDCGFSRRKSLYLASETADVASLRKEFRARHDAGFRVDLWGQADIEAKFMFSRPLGIWSHQAAQVDPYRLVHALVRHAVARGARVFDRTSVASLESDARGVVALTEDGVKVRAAHVVVAAGYESLRFLRKKDLVRLHSSFALASKPLEDFNGWYERCLVWETARPYTYMRTTADGRAVVGGEDEPFRDPPRRDALVTRKCARLSQTFADMFPQCDFEAAYAWAGTFGETRDGLPYIGAVPEHPRCYFVCGYGGNGTTYSAVAADIVRDTILGRPHRYARVFAFDR